MEENELYPKEIDLDNCAREPIHIIGHIQEFGCLLVADITNLKIVQCSENVFDFLPWNSQELLGMNLSEVLGTSVTTNLQQELKDQISLSPVDCQIGGKKFHLAPHLSDVHLLMDLEPLREDLNWQEADPSRLFMDFREKRLKENIFEKTASLAKRYFGYDRVLIYQFDHQWNGKVVGEAREEALQSWYGLHYPSTDIPAQSRAMFLKNGLRIIADVDYTPVPLTSGRSPISDAPLDLTPSSLRAVSPIHIEYLQNMGVGASITAAIEVNGVLWGLMTGHHSGPRFLSYFQRESYHFLAQMLAMELALEESATYRRELARMDRSREQLVQHIRRTHDVPRALFGEEITVTDLFSCTGGALYVKGDWYLTGEHPAKADLEQLLTEVLMPHKDAMYYTETLGKEYEKAWKYKEIASGLLSLRMAENKYLLLFRPEVIKTVNWGGNPGNKAFYDPNKQRLSPRKSFEKWTELQQGTALPWKDYELSELKKLGESLSYEFLDRLRKETQVLYSQLSEANEELQLFTYGLSHDLKAPVRGIDGVMNILLEDYSDQLDAEGKSYIHKTIRLNKKVEDMIDDILTYSKMSHTDNLELEEINTTGLLEEVLDLISAKSRYPNARIHFQQNLPHCYGDRGMLIQVWANLLSNALKYSTDKPAPVVEIGYLSQKDRTIIFIRDNGLGFPQKLQDAIFEPFTRAVGSKIEGSGIGLALVRKIVEKHQGEIWAEGTPGEGSIFYLYLPPKTEAT